MSLEYVHVTYYSLCIAKSTIRFLPRENSNQSGHLLSRSLIIACDQWVAKDQLHVMLCILTTKNASLIITDFLHVAMVYKNVQ